MTKWNAPTISGTKIKEARYKDDYWYHNIEWKEGDDPANEYQEAALCKEYHKNKTKIKIMDDLIKYIIIIINTVIRMIVIKIIDGVGCDT